MKKLSFFILVLLVASCNPTSNTLPTLETDVVLNYPKSNGVYLRDIAFANSSIGYAVGLQDFMFKTSDGGASWQWQAIPANLDFGLSANGMYSIHFENANMGFICGNPGNNQGYIAKTTDQGISWVIKTGFIGTIPEEIDFDGNIGIAIGQNSQVVRSSDSGETWTVITSLPISGQNLDRVNMNDPSNYYISSDDVLWKSTDLGLTWIDVPVPSSGGSEIVFNGNYQMQSATVGYVKGSSTISKTTDAGLTWTQIFQSNQGVGFSTGHQLLLAEANYVCIQNTVDDEFWVSSDGGATFSKYKMPADSYQEFDMQLYTIWPQFAVNGNYIYCILENSFSAAAQCIHRIKYK